MKQFDEYLLSYFSDLCVCQPLIQDTGREYLVYVELFVRSDNQSQIKRPRIRCDKESTAAWVKILSIIFLIAPTPTIAPSFFSSQNSDEVFIRDNFV